MKTPLLLVKMKITFVAIFLLFAIAVQAQKTKMIGNKPREGSSNSTFAVIKGNQIGVKMKAGSKVVQLLKLNFGVENRGSDTLKFKVNIYDFSNVLPGENLVKDEIKGSIPKGKNRIDVDLVPYNINAKGDILVSIEWLNNQQVKEPSFAIGLFNGGTWNYEHGAWKKTPVAGVDFNVLVEKQKR